MTIQVQICNNEPAGGRSLVVQETHFDKETQSRRLYNKIELGPGESRTFYVHLLKELQVSEAHPENL